MNGLGLVALQKVSGLWLLALHDVAMMGLLFLQEATGARGYRQTDLGPLFLQELTRKRPVGLLEDA